MILIFGALFFLYVGVENAFGGWIASYAKSLGSLTPTVAFMSPSFFYSALMLGRWLAPLLLRVTAEIRWCGRGCFWHAPAWRGWFCLTAWREL